MVRGRSEGFRLELERMTRKMMGREEMKRDAFFLFLNRSNDDIFSLGFCASRAVSKKRAEMDGPESAPRSSELFGTSYRELSQS